MKLYRARLMQSMDHILKSKIDISKAKISEYSYFDEERDKYTTYTNLDFEDLDLLNSFIKSWDEYVLS